MVPDYLLSPFSVVLSTVFPTGALLLTTLALLFLKQIPFLPHPKTLQLLFWKCSSPRPAWLATSLV